MKRLVPIVAALALAVPAQGDAHLYTGCKKRGCKLHVVTPYNGALERIARCESGRRWHLNIGQFDGGLQFSPSTWAQTGSRFTYAWQASGPEQKYRAVLWASRIRFAWSSTAGWPVCGRGAS